ncbi:hypothetical protein ACFL59_11780 [Planctomycetota bacterium]
MNLGRAPGPVFRWLSPVEYDAGEADGKHVEFTLVVSRNREFQSNAKILEATIRDQESYRIEPGEGWLRSGKTYFWKVTGVVVDSNGDVVDKLECERSRAFRIKPRDTVEIDLSLPVGSDPTIRKGSSATEVTIGDQKFTSDGTLRLEHGENRRLIVRAWHEGKRITAGGHLTAVKVNETTKFGRVNVKIGIGDLIQVGKGEVLYHSYSLGGEEVVTMTLGSRVD